MDHGSAGKSGWESDMAVEQNESETPQAHKLMRDYLPQFRSKVYVTFTWVQTSIVFISLLICTLLGFIKLGWIGLFAMTFIGAGLLNLATFILLRKFGQPFADLVNAVVMVSGEPSDSTPPNPNRSEYENDGFKEILQTVYEGTVNEEKPSEESSGTDKTLRRGIDTMQTGIVIMDSHQNIVYHNNQAPVRTDTKGRPALDIIFSEENSLEDWLRSVSKNKVSADKQWSRVANRLPGEKDRRIFDIAASYHKNSTAETVLTFFDRTDDYMPEDDELDFISFAAHELRGPITVIRGYLDVLDDELKPSLKHDQAELMQRLIVASNRLDSYINNILNASRYDRRHMKFHLTEETVAHVYSQISDDMQMRAAAQNRVLVVDIPDTLPTVAADLPAVGEVMGNLIDNAIKYSNEGGLVHVSARAIPGFVEVSVSDRGIGMPQSVLPNLFHKFYRSHRSRETVAGTGIGLYICKAIVSSHGGKIDVRSVENEGSTFTFTLPTYDTVAEKLKASNNSNVTLIEHKNGWIRNHSMYRG